MPTATASSIRPHGAERRWLDALLAWYFVSVWGSGFLATKVALHYTAPFTFLTLRFAFGTVCLVPFLIITRPHWPASRRDVMHAVIAGLLMHGIYLSGSHYTQYLGVSAGITALLLSSQPLLTALIASRWMGEALVPRQWLGIAAGLGGVALVVWHKIDIHEMTIGSLLAVMISLFGVTAGTLYQRVFCPVIDLRVAAFLQFITNLVVLAPLAWLVEGFRVEWAWPMFGAMVYLVIGASMLAVSALHALMRRGQATRVTTLFYLTPVFAVVPEFLWFGVVPSLLSIVGIAVTCGGVALVAWRKPGESVST